MAITGEVSVSEKQGFIAIVAGLVSELYDLSMSANLVSSDGLSVEKYREELFKAQAEVARYARRGQVYLTQLVMEDFSRNTEEFNSAYTELKEVNRRIQDELNALEAMVRTFEKINEWLVVVDRGLEIAAGLAKSG